MIGLRKPRKSGKCRASYNASATSKNARSVTIFGVSMVCMFGFEADKFRRRLWADTVRNDDAFVLLDMSPAFSLPRIPLIAVN